MRIADTPLPLRYCSSLSPSLTTRCLNSDWHDEYLPLTGVNVAAKALVTANTSQPDRAFPYSNTYYSELSGIDR